MGAKEMLEIEEQKKIIVLEILMKAKAIKECKDCCDYTDNLDPESLKRAYKIGNKMISDNEESVAIFDDRNDLSDRIKSICDDTSKDCHCTTMMNQQQE